MICEFCGHDIPEGAKFCPNCATLVTPSKYKKQSSYKSANKPTAPIKKEQPPMQAPPTPKVEEKVQAAPVVKTEKKVVKKSAPKKQKSINLIEKIKSIPVNKRLLSIGCAGLAVIIAIIILFVSICGGNTLESGSIKATIYNGNAFICYGNGNGVKLSSADEIDSAIMTADHNHIVVSTKSGTLYTTDSKGENINTLYSSKEGVSVDFTLLGDKVLYHTYTDKSPIEHAYYIYNLNKKGATNIFSYTSSSEFQGIAFSSSNEKICSSEYAVIRAYKGRIDILRTNNLNDSFVNVSSYSKDETISGLYCSNNGKIAIWTTVTTNSTGNASYTLNIYNNNKIDKIKTPNAQNYMISSINSDVSVIFTTNSVMYVKGNKFAPANIPSATNAYSLDGNALSSSKSVVNQSGCLITARGEKGTNVYYLDYAKEAPTLLLAEAETVYNISKNRLIFKKDGKTNLGTVNTSSYTLETKPFANKVNYVYVSSDSTNNIYYTIISDGNTQLKRYDIRFDTTFDISENASSIKIGTNGEKAYFIEDLKYANVSYGSLIEYDAKSENLKPIDRNAISVSQTSNTLSGEIIPNSFFYQSLVNGEIQIKYYNGSSAKTVIASIA